MATAKVLSIRGLRFELDGIPFPFTGISFFNAAYNEAFNKSEAERRKWLAEFAGYKINVLRIWAQWDCTRGYVDGGVESTLYTEKGDLRPAPLARIKDIAASAAAMDFAVELVLFGRESWADNIRLSDTAMETAVTNLCEELRPFRNVTFQVWNEFSHHAIRLAEIIKERDPARLVSNAPGMAGDLLAPPHLGELEQKLDYLTPHTTRQEHGDGPHWRVVPHELALLIHRFAKPVIDDEPARNGLPDFGGPKSPTVPYDHIIQIYGAWQAGAHVVYHHDMFQTGAHSDQCPASGIPEPDFSSYHHQVLKFVALRDRYFPLYARDAVAHAAS